MLLERVKLGENMGLNEKLTKPNEEPNREMKMLMEILKSGSNEEKRKLAQALLELEIRRQA